MSAIPLYNLFVEGAKRLKPQYISMITPSRWFSGGKGLDDFRKEMLHDHHISKIVDFADASVCFPNNAIAGGINYFLWDSTHKGECLVTSIRGNQVSSVKRKLDEFDIFVRNNVSLNIIKKVLSSGDKTMEEMVYSRNVFGITSSEHGVPKPSKDYSVGLLNSKKGNSQGIDYISLNKVLRNKELIEKYKVIIGKVVPRNGEVGVDPAKGYRAITTVHIIPPGIVFTESYLLLGVFGEKREAENFAFFMTQKFPRFLLHETYSSMNITKSNFQFVPYLGVEKKWTDAELYERYNCNDEEINLVESMIRPLEYVEH